MKDNRDIDEITGEIVDAAHKLHTRKEGLHRVVNNYTPSASSRLRVNQDESYQTRY
jgi:hypothetical protein